MHKDKPPRKWETHNIWYGISIGFVFLFFGLWTWFIWTRPGIIHDHIGATMMMLSIPTLFCLILGLIYDPQIK